MLALEILLSICVWALGVGVCFLMHNLSVRIAFYAERITKSDDGAYFFTAMLLCPLCLVPVCFSIVFIVEYWT
jgi:hypothetical protein